MINILLNIIKNFFIKLSIFTVIIIILTLIFSGIYSSFTGINYIRTLLGIFELYGGFIFNIFIIIYKILTIPYIIIKTLIDVFSKFAIIFYFIINLFNGLTTFIYDVTSVEM
jgi:hypothetical protein